MTKQDFDLVLIESFLHEGKQSYFKAKRKDYKCFPEEYFKGLLEAFKRLNEYVNQTDNKRFKVTPIDGEPGEGELEDGNHNEQLQALQQIGKVTFPYKKSIDTNEYTNGQFKIILTAELMNTLWPDLNKYLQTVIDKKAKKAKSKTDNNLLNLEVQRLQNEVYMKLIESLPERKVNHSGLLTKLSKYIVGVTSEEFTNIIEHHSLSLGAQKAKWIGILADAHRFATYIEMKLPDFNNCFSFEDESRKLKHNNKDETDSAIKDILDNYFDK